MEVSRGGENETQRADGMDGRVVGPLDDRPLRVAEDGVGHRCKVRLCGRSHYERSVQREDVRREVQAHLVQCPLVFAGEHGGE